MSDIQEIHQSFELATLLFEKQFTSFEERFQSFVNQFSSYLHSSVKDGFFTHFFLGMFSTLSDTKLNDKLSIESISYGFVDQGPLKVAVRLLINGNEEVKFFSFSEKSKGKTLRESLFTNGDLERIIKNDKKSDEMKRIIDNQRELGKLKFTLVEIDKNLLGKENDKSIKVTNKEIEGSDNSCHVEKFKNIIKNLEDESTLEDYIEKLYSRIQDEDEYKDEIENSFSKIMRYIKNVFNGLGLFGKSEAEHHGLLAGFFDNFRYRYNTKIYIEQFAGRGYADIILLVRGPKREVCSIPIIIELKAGCSGNEVTAKSALEQAERYTYGCQLKKMRLATSAENILCVGLNLDLQNAFETKLISIQQESSPVINNILNTIYKHDLNHITEKIEELVSREYLSLPPTQEKSDPHYLGLFFLGQSLSLDKISMYEIKKHAYVKKTEEPSKRSTRSNPSSEIVLSNDSSLISMSFFPNTSNVNFRKIILLNIVAIHKDENKVISNYSEYDIKISALNDLYKNYENTLEDKEIVDVKLTLDLRKKIDNKTPIKCFLSTSIKLFKNYDAYRDSNLDHKFNINYKLTYQKNSKELMECFNKALCAQKDMNAPEKFLSENYKSLLEIIGVSVYNFKSLIIKEAHFQAVLHGLFDYHSDIKSKEGVRELVLTEFQTGAGDRIDMIIQIIGSSKENISKYKEYVPVGLELKYISGTFSENQENELKAQMSRYADGKAIKAITDGRKIAVIGVVFSKNAPDGNSLILMYEGDKTIRDLERHSSIMNPPPGGVDTLTQNLSTSESQLLTGGGGRSGTEPDAPWDKKIIVRR